MAITKMNSGSNNNGVDSTPINTITLTTNEVFKPVTQINPIVFATYEPTITTQSIPQLDNDTYTGYLDKLLNEAEKIPFIKNDFSIDTVYDSKQILNNYTQVNSADGSITLYDLLNIVKGGYGALSSLITYNDGVYKKLIFDSEDQILLAMGQITATNDYIYSVEAGISIKVGEVRAYVDSLYTDVNGSIHTLNQLIIDTNGITLSAIRDEMNAMGQYISRNYASLEVFNDRIATLVSQQLFDELGNLVSKHESSIVQLADSITLKVNQEEFNYLSTKVFHNESQIQLLSDEISLRVTSEEFSALGSQVSLQESKITLLSNEILLKVSQVDFDNLGQRVGMAESTIIQQANQISLRVTEDTFNALAQRVSNSESAIIQTAHDITLRVTQYDFDQLGIVVGNHTTLIQQNANEISLRATTTTVNNIGDRLTTAESRITVASDKISLLVTADNVVKAGVIVDAINDGTVKIVASKINIDGTTTFGNGYNPHQNSRNFVIQPTTPYKVGDTWIKDNELYSCSVTRLTGNFNANDWYKSVKYTDDTIAKSKHKKYVTTYFTDPSTATDYDPLKDITADSERAIHVGDEWIATDWTLNSDTGLIEMTGLRRKTFVYENSTYIWVFDTTVIDGGRISTGVINADLIDAKALFSKTLTADNLTVVKGKVGNFTIDKALTGTDGTNVILLDPDNTRILLDNGSGKTVDIKAGALTGRAILTGNNYSFTNIGYGVSVSQFGNIYLSTLKANQTNFLTSTPYTSYIGYNSSTSKTVVAQAKASVSLFSLASVGKTTVYTFNVPVNLAFVHSMVKHDGKYDKRRGNLRWNIQVAVYNNLDVLVSNVSTHDSAVFVDDNSTATLLYGAMHRLQVNVPSGGGTYYIKVTTRLSGDVQYQEWKNPTIGSSYWQTDAGADNAMVFGVDTTYAFRIDAAAGKTELTTDGFQTVWSDSKYFRIDGNNASTFIESAGDWMHNGRSVMTVETGQSSVLDLTLYADKNWVNTGFLSLAGGTVAGATVINGTLTVNGNIVQSGSSYETHAEQVYTKDDFIILREGAIAALGTGVYAGFKAIKYDGTNSGWLAFDNSGTAWVGDEGALQPIATRDTIANMVTNSITYWDGTTLKLKTRSSAFDSDKLGGFGAADYTRRNVAETITSPWTIANNVVIKTSSQLAKDVSSRILSINGYGSTMLGTVYMTISTTNDISFSAGHDGDNRVSFVGAYGSHGGVYDDFAIRTLSADGVVNRLRISHDGIVTMTKGIVNIGYNGDVCRISNDTIAFNGLGNLSINGAGYNAKFAIKNNIYDNVATFVDRSDREYLRMGFHSGTVSKERAAIHVFSDLWGSSFNDSKGCMNLDALSGVTIGAHNNPTLRIDTVNHLVGVNISPVDSSNRAFSVKGVTAIGQFTNGTAVIDAHNGYAYYGCNSAENGLKVDRWGGVTVTQDLAVGGSLYSGIANGDTRAILGPKLGWNGVSYPSLYSDAGDNWVMLHNPHICWKQNGQRGYSGSNYGAVVRIEGGTSGGGYWDIGARYNTSYFSIAKNDNIVFNVDASGNQVSYGNLNSPSFESGFNGNGWKLDVSNGVTLTIDNLNVRKTMMVNELLINQIRATNGSLWVSDGLKLTYSQKGAYYDFYFDTDGGRKGCPFVSGDIILAQRFDGRNVVRISGVVVKDNGWMPAALVCISTLYEGTPVVGETYDFVRIGNVNNINRQGSIYLTASDDGAPFIDVLDGVNSNHPTSPRNIRYIRDWLNGSSADAGNHWVEIKAHNVAGDNVAYGKDIYDSATGTYRSGTTVTNNNTYTGDYFYGGEGSRRFVQIDLGSVREIDSVYVYHYNSDNRTYNETQTQVSADGVTWYDLHNYLTDGTYAETVNGRQYKLGASKTKVRLGNLRGIYDLAVGGQLSGYGLYADNVFLKGRIVAKTGNIAGYNIGYYNNNTAQPCLVAPGNKLAIYNDLNNGNYNYIKIGKSSWVDDNDFVALGGYGGEQGLFCNSGGGRVVTFDIVNNIYQIAGWRFTSSRFYTGVDDNGQGVGFFINNGNSGSGYIFEHSRRLQGFGMTWHKSANAGHIIMGQVAANGQSVKDGFYGIQMMNWMGEEFFCLSAKVDQSDGGRTYYNRIGGWSFDTNRIYSTNGRIELHAGQSSIYVSKPSGGHVMLGQTFANNNWTGQYGISGTDSGGNTLFRLDDSGNSIAGWRFNTTSIFNGSSSYVQAMLNNAWTNVAHNGIALQITDFSKSPSLVAQWSGGNNQSDSGNISVGRILRHYVAWDDKVGINFYHAQKTYFEISRSLVDGSITALIAGCNFNASSIYAGNMWSLNADGSGRLANGCISWTSTGVLTVDGGVVTNKIQSSNWNNSTLGSKLDIGTGTFYLGGDRITFEADDTTGKLIRIKADDGNTGVYLGNFTLTSVSSLSGNEIVTNNSTNYRKFVTITGASYAGTTEATISNQLIGYLTAVNAGAFSISDTASNITLSANTTYNITFAVKLAITSNTDNEYIQIPYSVYEDGMGADGSVIADLMDGNNAVLATISRSLTAGSSGSTSFTFNVKTTATGIVRVKLRFSGNGHNIISQLDPTKSFYQVYIYGFDLKLTCASAFIAQSKAGISEVSSKGFQVIKDATNYFRIDQIITATTSNYIESYGKWEHNGAMMASVHTKATIVNLTANYTVPVTNTKFIFKTSAAYNITLPTLAQIEAVYGTGNADGYCIMLGCYYTNSANITIITSHYDNNGSASSSRALSKGDVLIMYIISGVWHIQNLIL